LLADYVQRHGSQRDHRGAKIDAGLLNQKTQKSPPTPDPKVDAPK
jgi:hypothetical protein